MKSYEKPRLEVQMSSQKKCVICHFSAWEGHYFDPTHFVCQKCHFCVQCGGESNPFALVDLLESPKILCGECWTVNVEKEMVDRFRQEHPELFE